MDGGSSLCLKDFLSHHVQSEPGVFGIIVSDNVGVPIAQEWSQAGKEFQNRLKTNSQIILAFPTASEQASKLGLGSSDTFVASFNKYQIIQFNKLHEHNLVITLFAKKDCNTGLLLEKADEWEQTAAAINKQILSQMPRVTI